MEEEIGFLFVWGQTIADLNRGGMGFFPNEQKERTRGAGR